MIETLFGLISGTVTGLGMGGGTILILMLSIFVGLEQHVAQATNLIFFVPTSLAAIIINLKNKNVDIKLAILISFFGIIGAILGAIVANKIESNMLRKFFALFILFIALREVYNFYKQYKSKHKKT